MILFLYWVGFFFGVISRLIKFAEGEETQCEGVGNTQEDRTSDLERLEQWELQAMRGNLVLINLKSYTR